MTELNYINLSYVSYKLILYSNHFGLFGFIYGQYESECMCGLD